MIQLYAKPLPLALRALPPTDLTSFFGECGTTCQRWSFLHRYMTHFTFNSRTRLMSLLRLTRPCACAACPLLEIAVYLTFLEKLKPDGTGAATTPSPTQMASASYKAAQTLAEDSA